MLSKKKALGSLSKNQGLLSKKMAQRKAVSPLQAIKKSNAQAGTHKDIGVMGSSMRAVGSTGTTTGSTKPQAPDQVSVTRSVIQQRLGDKKSPRATEKDVNPMVSVNPPGSPRYAHESKGPVYMSQAAREQARRSRGKMKGFSRQNRLRGTFR